MYLCFSCHNMLAMYLCCSCHNMLAMYLCFSCHNMLAMYLCCSCHNMLAMYLCCSCHNMLAMYLCCSCHNMLAMYPCCITVLCGAFPLNFLKSYLLALHRIRTSSGFFAFFYPITFNVYVFFHNVILVKAAQFLIIYVLIIIDTIYLIFNKNLVRSTYIYLFIHTYIIYIRSSLKQ